MRANIVCAGAILCGISVAVTGVISSPRAEEWVKIVPISSFWECKGNCAVTIFAGPQLITGLGHVDGAKTFIPPWKYTYANSGLLGGTLSETLVEFANFATIEGELGLGQRFGSLHETETWAALYLRWKLFPWNKFIVTTLALSTGLTYASATPPYEVDQSGNGQGSRLLHYFSPEITFALPSKPDYEFVIRAHHRSGGAEYWGNVRMFNGVEGGVQYLVFGVRHRF